MKNQKHYTFFVLGIIAFVFLIQYLDENISFPFEKQIQSIHIVGKNALSPAFVYLLLAGLVFAILRKSKKIVFSLFKLFYFISHKPCKKGKIKNALSKDMIKKMAIGGIYGEQQLMTTNTLETGVFRFMNKQILKTDWEITDRESALEKIEILRNKKQSKHFEFIYDLYKNKNTEEWDQIIEENFEDDKDIYEINIRLYSFIDCIDDLIAEHSYKESDFSKGITAWDMGRLTGISRMCFDCKYISRQEAISNIEFAYEECSKTYQNWEEIKRAYLLGRVIWKGSVDALPTMNLFVKRITTNPLSPWKEYSFT
jgi:hypothetical protein